MYPQKLPSMKPMTAAEEKEIMNALESGAIQLETPSRKLLSDLKKASDHSLKKDRRISTRTNEPPVSPGVTQPLPRL
jgi:hypothetical protein